MDRFSDAQKIKVNLQSLISQYKNLGDSIQDEIVKDDLENVIRIERLKLKIVCSQNIFEDIENLISSHCELEPEDRIWDIYFFEGARVESISPNDLIKIVSLAYDDKQLNKLIDTYGMPNIERPVEEVSTLSSRQNLEMNKETINIIETAHIISIEKETQSLLEYSQAS